MKILNSLLLQVLQKIPTQALKPNLFTFSSSTKTPTQTPNTLLFNYLIQTLNFSKAEARSISNATRFSKIKSLENQHSVLNYFRSLGFTETDIRSSVRYAPQILLSDVEKTLKPKIEFFQEMGLVGSHLGKCISRHSRILTYSLQKKLIPSTQILKNILVNDKNNQDLFPVFNRLGYDSCIPDESRLLSSIAVFESCGIVGSQLSLLLRLKPRLFTTGESKIRDLVSRVSDTGLSVNSGMFVHGLCTISGMGEATFERKLKLVRSFGFTHHEALGMFQKQPSMFNKSEEQLKLVIDFFLNKIELNKEALIRGPRCLLHSLEGRVLPRYRVMQILKLKRLLKKEPSFANLLTLSEKEFLEKYVTRFTEDAEELLVAYKNRLSDPPLLLHPMQREKVEASLNPSEINRCNSHFCL